MKIKFFVETKEVKLDQEPRIKEYTKLIKKSRPKVINFELWRLIEAMLEEDERDKLFKFVDNDMQKFYVYIKTKIESRLKNKIVIFSRHYIKVDYDFRSGLDAAKVYMIDQWYKRFKTMQENIYLVRKDSWKYNSYLYEKTLFHKVDKVNQDNCPVAKYPKNFFWKLEQEPYKHKKKYDQYPKTIFTLEKQLRHAPEIVSYGHFLDNLLKFLNATYSLKFDKAFEDKLLFNYLQRKHENLILNYDVRVPESLHKIKFTSKSAQNKFQRVLLAAKENMKVEYLFVIITNVLYSSKTQQKENISFEVGGNLPFSVFDFKFFQFIDHKVVYDAFAKLKSIVRSSAYLPSTNWKEIKY
ncbi:hypothetical protein [Mycoplasmopsis synoviae]|uniref:hypothetical protein n=1 Tax=Mycoplasmopsis synoviae TaxID=2109 RepID=UPI001CE19A10|nr:hypothetical protein [Mycoplasmopsis synoviae]UBX98548.1 hypothetical protein K6986_02285 [Mycoplasmopsis synoviae]